MQKFHSPSLGWIPGKENEEKCLVQTFHRPSLGRIPGKENEKLCLVQTLHWSSLGWIPGKENEQTFHRPYSKNQGLGKETQLCLIKLLCL